MTSTVKIERSNLVKSKKCVLFCIGMFVCMYRPEICAGAKCGRPGRTTNSRYELDGKDKEFNESDTVKYTCLESDHIILGPSERTCLTNGSWSDEIPVCSKVSQIEAVDCQDTFEGRNNTIDGDMSSCSEESTFWIGYLRTSVKIYAVQISVRGLRDLDISVNVQEENSSISKNCDLKNEDKAFTIFSSKPITTLTFYCPSATVGKYVHISCNSRPLIFCEASILQPPVDSCYYPDMPLHATGYKLSEQNSEVYKFRCDDGYKLWGELLVTCQADGRWIPKSPFCEEIRCSSPGGIANGEVEFDITNRRIPYNATAVYKCNDGYSLYGKSVIRCVKWEMWDAEPPVCKPITENTASIRNLPITESWRQSEEIHCGKLPHVANGVLVANSSNAGSIARLHCSEGYSPLTDDFTWCLSTGKWSSQSLHCAIIECERNPFIPHGKALLLQNTSNYGSHLEIQCNQGYTSQFPILRKCGESGSWGNLDVCVEITCGSFETDDVSQGHWIPVNGSTSLRVLICPENFYIEGTPAVIRCLSNGSWSYTTAKCKMSFSNPWGSNWTPSLMIVAAVAAGIGTAVIILCLSMTVLVIKKRYQARTNTTVFHLQNLSEKDFKGMNLHQQKHLSAAESYIIERRSKSLNTNPRKPRSALPNLPVDADPVYAQPFEAPAGTKKVSISISNKKDDIYNAHIYAEPVDSKRNTPTHTSINITNSQTGSDRRSSMPKTNFKNDLPVPFPADQQNCDKKCAIYDSSGSSILNGMQVTTNDTYQSCSKKTELGTLEKKQEYLKLL